jgi:hypothetical protein
MPSSRERFRLVTAPDKSWVPQLNWIYEPLSLSAVGRVKLRLVELPEGDAPGTIFEITVPLGHIARYFEVVADAV